MRMDDRMKQRLVGAAVLVIAAVIFVPMLLDEGEEGAPQIVPAPRIIQPEPLPADADARAVPLGDERAAAPAPAAPAPPQPAPAPPAPRKEQPPAKTATAPAPAKQATKSGYAVQLGSFTKAGNARGLRDKLAARGYAAFVKSTGSVTRVYVGPQPSRAAAEKMLKKLHKETKLEGIVVTLPE